MRRRTFSRQGKSRDSLLEPPGQRPEASVVQREPRSAPPEMTLGSTPGRGILRGRFQGISLETDRICPEPLQTASPRPSGQPSGQPSGSSRHSCREALRTAVGKLSGQLSGSSPHNCLEALRTTVGKPSGEGVWDSCLGQLPDSSLGPLPDSCLGPLPDSCLGRLPDSYLPRAF